MTSIGRHENWKPLRTWTRPITPTQNKKKLADCAPRFARGTTSGKGGEFYVVTDPINNVFDPKPRTLRHAATQTGPLWITFKRSMTIKLE
ncbi:hypothetical protein Godav_009949 [Gossypium davidsonii]|uniref:Uncharacterized protein n=1 Tax=Gossypium davidsonii TaxID=34287 RepID=A0A7J8SEY8_GOSDV|nr:hypothetical protein [Gossypium davidsonii]